TSHRPPPPPPPSPPPSSGGSPPGTAPPPLPGPLPPPALVPTSLFPCWLHTPPLRVNTHAAPAPALSLTPPTIAVLPSADSATEKPWAEFPTALLPTSLVPCWFHTPPLRVKTQAAPT